jgi:hypothetical protein
MPKSSSPVRLQIEYWAALGRRVAQLVAPEPIFSAVEDDRRSGELAKMVSPAAIRYQASPAKPGQLERISGDGTRTLGTFQNGIFIPSDA